MHKSRSSNFAPKCLKRFTFHTFLALHSRTSLNLRLKIYARVSLMVLDLHNSHSRFKLHISHFALHFTFSRARISPQAYDMHGAMMAISVLCLNNESRT